MCESGKYTKVAQSPPKTSQVPNFIRSATAPLISATVMTAKVSWKATHTMAGTVPKPPETKVSTPSISRTSASWFTPNSENGLSKNRPG